MKDPRCAITFHKYVVNRSSDGTGTYLECRRCGKVKDIPDPSAFAAF